MIFPEHDRGPDEPQSDLDDQTSPHLWDLNVIDYGEPWTAIGRKAKSFVKGCLVFDESQRFTAKQALLHPWFTNKHYAAEIEAAYERAIEDWKPRAKSGNVIEVIDTTDAVPTAYGLGHVNRLAEEVRSRHFQTMGPYIPMLFVSTKANALMPQQKHVRTPLPAISEEAHDHSIMVPASPGMGPGANMFASPTCTQAPLTFRTSQPMRIWDASPS